jgi:aminocarboxymuconate-semialdehyde decarboxylase
MPIDVHAHYVPKEILDVLTAGGSRYGVEVVTVQPSCAQCLKFESGLQVRPFFPRLLEEPAARIGWMQEAGLDRQILSIWADIFGYGLPPEKGAAWHGLMNDCLGRFCEQHDRAFSWLASGPLNDAARAARELERAVTQSGAIGAVVAANVDGVNLGELPLDEYWAAAVALDVPVFIHPTQPSPAARSKRFALNQTVQYTFDTTLAFGSLVESGVLDRFPDLQLVLSHGGGGVPYLIGRFDCMHANGDRVGQGMVAKAQPSAYLRRMHYDSILHSPEALRYLAGVVGTDRIVVGTDESFPPADRDPMGSLRRAGFSASELHAIAEDNPRRLFRHLHEGK